MANNKEEAGKGTPTTGRRPRREAHLCYDRSVGVGGRKQGQVASSRGIGGVRDFSGGRRLSI